MNNEAETIRPAEPVTGVESAAEIPAAAETAPPAAESGQDGQHKPSWEEILQDPDYRSSYDQAVQGIVKARLRGRAQAEERLEKLSPVLRVLEERYGLTEGSDAESLAQNLRERAEAYRPEGAGIAAHLQTMYAEAEALKQRVADQSEELALLKQSQRNTLYSENGTLHFSVPDGTQTAYVQLCNESGRQIRLVNVTGTGSLVLTDEDLPAGTGYASLLVDGSLAGTQRITLK